MTTTALLIPVTVALVLIILFMRVTALLGPSEATLFVALYSTVTVSAVTAFVGIAGTANAALTSSINVEIKYFI
jgi:hypothetical protein